MSGTVEQPSGDAVREAVALLYHERRALDGLSREIEPEFVRLGATLGDMASVVSKVAVTAEALRLTAQMGGDQRGLVRTPELFAKVAGGVGTGIKRAERLRAGLNSVSNAMRDVATQEGEFANAVTVFWMLKTGFRVEAAVLPPAYRGLLVGLTSGMDEVHQGLRDVIDAQFARLFKAAKVVASLESELRDLQASARETLHDSRAQVEREVAIVSKALSPAAGFSEVVTKQAAHGTKRVNGVIVALQYPDIVRQKVEHMVDAIDEIESRLGAKGPHCDAVANAVSAAPAIYLVARVQVEQLRDARAEIERAGQNTVAGIRELLSVGEAVLQAGMRLQRLAVEGLREVRESASAIERMQALHRSVSADIDSVIQRVRAIVLTEIRGLVEDLSAHVLRKTQDVRQVALNASAQAVRVPGARALGELAGLTQSNSEEVFALTGTMLARAKVILADVESLQSTIEHLSQLSTAEERAISEDVEGARVVIEEAYERALHSFDGIESEFNRVRGITQETLRRLQFTETVAQRMGKAEAAFLRLVTTTAPLFARAKGDPRVQATLDELQSKYTMQRERDLHAAATVAARASCVLKVAAVSLGSSAVTESDVTGDDGFGDNIDLF